MLKLRTTMADFEAAHAALAKIKRGTARVCIPVTALQTLLADHSRLNAALRGIVEE